LIVTLSETSSILFILIVSLVGLVGLGSISNVTITSGIKVPNIVNFSLTQDVVGARPQVYDPGLKVETVAQGLKLPTSITFLGPKDILVLEKDRGTVTRIVDGKILSQPLLNLSAATYLERGMQGIEVARENSHTFIFISFTGSGGGRLGDDSSEGLQPVGNVLYKYELIKEKSGQLQLRPDMLLLLLPATPGPYHNGGKIIIGPDKNVYYSIGDVSLDSRSVLPKSLFHHTKAQNFQNGTDPDGSSGILRITKNGTAVGKGIIGSVYPVNLYYAYGIRNSFGMDFDPLTGNLWDTENGPRYGDEINLVIPGFNSGWRTVQGIWKPMDVSYAGNLTLKPKDLVDFGGKGKYRPPEFIWNKPVGPTALKFLTSDRLGAQYKNDMFVGDFNNGRIYHFKLNKDRTSLVLGGILADKIAKADSDLKDVIFGDGFGGISDIKVGPDGDLYIVSIGQGKIYRITSQEKHQNNTGPASVHESSSNNRASSASPSSLAQIRGDRDHFDYNYTNFDSWTSETRIHLNQSIMALDFGDIQAALDQLRLAERQLSIHFKEPF
jgi:aldose sugar dehydrogenase